MTRLHLAAPPTDQRSPDGQPVKVVLADDHLLMRRSLRLLLESEADMSVVAEAGDLSAVLEHLHGRDAHVLVADLAAPGAGRSVRAIADLRRRAPHTEVVVLTLHDDPGFARAMLDAGALGFVLKDAADDDLADAVRAAAKGERFVSPSVLAQMQSLDPRADDVLSERELEVLRLIALGHTTEEIARHFHLSPRTIETYRTRIHRKLGLTKRSHLVAYALRRGLLKV
jgi:two-component system, NarL family, response regulator NreC